MWLNKLINMNNKNIVTIIYFIKNMYDYETDTIYCVEVRMVYNEYDELIRILI